MKTDIKKIIKKGTAFAVMLTVMLTSVLVIDMDGVMAAPRAPGKPKITSATTSGKYASIKWSKPKRSKKYQVAKVTYYKGWKYWKKVRRTNANYRKYKSYKRVRSGRYYKIYKWGTKTKYTRLKTTKLRNAKINVGYGTTTNLAVRAYYRAWGKWSATKTLYTIPSAPTNVKADMNGIESVVTWSKVKGATSYEVYRSNPELDDSGNIIEGPFVFMKNVSTNKFVEATSEVNIPYTYKIISLRKLSNGEILKSPFSKKVSVLPQFGAPESFIAQEMDGIVTVQWKKVPGAVSYGIWKNGSKLRASSSDKSFKDPSGTVNDRYKVSAINKNGIEEVSELELNPTHQHNYQPVYEKKKVVVDTEMVEHIYCNACNQDLTEEANEYFEQEELGNITGPQDTYSFPFWQHLDAHLFAGEPSGWHTDSVLENIYETQNVMVHRKCSCGATLK